MGYEQGKSSNDTNKENTITINKKEDSSRLENDGFTQVKKEGDLMQNQGVLNNTPASYIPSMDIILNVILMEKKF